MPLAIDEDTTDWIFLLDRLLAHRTLAFIPGKCFGLVGNMSSKTFLSLMYKTHSKFSGYRDFWPFVRSTNSGHVDKVVASLRLSSQIVRTIGGVGSETGWNGFRSDDGFAVGPSRPCVHVAPVVDTDF